MDSAPQSSESYDVVIIGGALAGAASALLLLGEDPGLKVLILEKSGAFGRRVGEATVEVSGYFLSRQLGLTQHLNEAHLVKQGMRFWFFNSRAQTLSQCSEIGGRYLSRIPSYQVDRAILDQEILRRAQAMVVDVSGGAALLARQEGWWRQNEAHPTTAVWARWTLVKDWDGLELAKKYPDWAMACHGIRGTATNHLIGKGWWAWCIPLKGGDVSIGAVFDQRLVSWPEHGPLGERLKG